MSSPFTVPLDKIWIVTAVSGRYSGRAYVRADTKTEANQIAQNVGWLDRGRVLKNETKLLTAWHEENEGVIDVEEICTHHLFPSDVTAINSLLVSGDWEEIEWGT